MRWSIWAFPTLMVALVRSTQKILQIAIKLPKRSKPVVHVGHFAACACWCYANETCGSWNYFMWYNKICFYFCDSLLWENLLE